MREKIYLILVLTSLLGCLTIYLFIKNDNNIYFDKGYVYMSVKSDVYYIDGDLKKDDFKSKYELNYVLNDKQIKILEEKLNNKKLQIDNIDIIDTPLEGCYVQFAEGKAVQIIYTMSGEKKVIIFKNGSEDIVYLK